MTVLYNPFSNGYVISPKHIPDEIKKNRCARELFNYFLHEVNFRLKDGIMRGQMSTSYKKIQQDLAWSYGRGVQTYTKEQIKKGVSLLKKYAIISTKVSQNDFIVNFLTYDLSQKIENYKLLKSHDDFESAFYETTRKNSEDPSQSSDPSWSENIRPHGERYETTHKHTYKHTGINSEDPSQSSDPSWSENLQDHAQKHFPDHALVHTSVKEHTKYIYNNNKYTCVRARGGSDENVPHGTDEPNTKGDEEMENQKLNEQQHDNCFDDEIEAYERSSREGFTQEPDEDYEDDFDHEAWKNRE